MRKESISNIGAIHNHCAEDRLQKWQKDNKEFKVMTGMFVKLGFPIPKEKHKREWMWVRITRELEDNQYEGILCNDPILVDDLSNGDEVEFNRDEICEHQTFLLN